MRALCFEHYKTQSLKFATQHENFDSINALSNFIILV